MYVQARQNINHDQFFTTQVFPAKIVRKKHAPSHRMTFFKHANKSQSIRRSCNDFIDSLQKQFDMFT